MQKTAAVFAVVVAMFTTSHAQTVKEIIKKGEIQYNAREYVKALVIFQDGLKAFPQDAKINFWTGLTYLSLPSKSESLRYLQTAFTNDHKVDPKIYFYLGLSYHSNKLYQKAEEFFTEYKKRHRADAELADEMIRQSEFADSVTRAPTNAVVENVGSAINSQFHEYSPLVSADGNTMIFTSNRPDAQIKGPLFEDIYISKKIKGQWSMPKKISPNINIKFNDAAASLSADGKTLVIYYEYGGGDIYISKLEGQDWSKPTPLNKNVNTPGFWETSAFLAPDGKKLYFTSNRPGGMGNLDIYVSEMESTGDWGQAKNLGNVINTKGREDSPSLDNAGTTLYFASNGHRGMGGMDIFKSELKEGKWQKPVNMGYPINSVEDDSFFAITGDHKRAYFSTLREEGNAEIYTLTFIEPDLGITVASEQSNQKAMEAKKAIPPPVAKSTAAKTPRSPRKSSSTKLPVAPPVKTFDIAKRPVNIDKSIPRKYIFFEIAEDDLNSDATKKLLSVVSILNEKTTGGSLIEGHTDNTGSAILNMALSIKRANSVAKYLTVKGISPSRISVTGYGSKKPLVSNDDEKDGRELNRRIEIAFTK
ncbi:MAG: OmpA family protein [Chryseolinea sp.]